jgi:hypothetical protein
VINAVNPMAALGLRLLLENACLLKLDADIENTEGWKTFRGKIDDVKET